MTKYFSASLLLLFAAAAACSPARSVRPWDPHATSTAVAVPDLRAELLEMARRDQEIRHELFPRPPRGVIGLLFYRLPRMTKEEFLVFREKLEAVDGPNRERLREIIESGGWPGLSRVGADGAQAAWLIAEHSPPEFQKDCLALMIEGARIGEVPLDQVRTLHLRACSDPESELRIGKSRYAAVNSRLTLDEMQRCISTAPTKVGARREKEPPSPADEADEIRQSRSGP